MSVILHRPVFGPLVQRNDKVNEQKQKWYTLVGGKLFCSITHTHTLFFYLLIAYFSRQMALGTRELSSHSLGHLRSSLSHLFNNNVMEAFMVAAIIIDFFL